MSIINENKSGENRNAPDRVALARPAVPTWNKSIQDHNVCNVSTMADLVFARLAGGPF